MTLLLAGKYILIKKPVVITYCSELSFFGLLDAADTISVCYYQCLTLLWTNRVNLREIWEYILM